MSAGGPRKGARATDPGSRKCPPRGISRQRARLHVSLGRFRGTLRAGVPWEGPRETDFATEGGKGDGFRPESVPLAGSRGSGHQGMPRSASRETLHATRGGKGEGACHGMQQGGSCTPRETAREKVPSPLPLRPLRPRAVPRHFARRQAVESTKGDVFRRGRGRGRRIRGRKRRPCGVPRQRRAGRARRARG